MAHLKHNNVLHPQILLHEIHPLRPIVILIRIHVLAVQPVHHVLLKMLQEVDLGLETILGVVRQRVILAHVDGGAWAAVGDIVEMAEK